MKDRLVQVLSLTEIEYSRIAAYVLTSTISRMWKEIGVAPVRTRIWAEGDLLYIEMVDDRDWRERYALARMLLHMQADYDLHKTLAKKGSL